MPVIVRPDGWEWGKKEGPPLFRIFEFPNLSVEELQALLDEEDLQEEPDLISGGTMVVKFARRKRRFIELQMAIADQSAGGWVTDETVKTTIAFDSKFTEVFPRDEVKRKPITQRDPREDS